MSSLLKQLETIGQSADKSKAELKNFDLETLHRLERQQMGAILLTPDAIKKS